LLAVSFSQFDPKRTSLPAARDVPSLSADLIGLKVILHC
jgi:hypothetical protein